MSYQNLKTNIIIALQSKGYDHDFILDNKDIRCLQYNQLIPPEGFEINEIHYCNRGVSGKPPAAIYAIQLNNHDIKGIIVSNHSGGIQEIDLRIRADDHRTIKNGIGPHMVDTILIEW